MKFKLSNQAVGALMLALQKGIMEQTDITELIKEFELVETSEGLIVDNPPVIDTSSISTPEEVSENA